MKRMMGLVSTNYSGNDFGMLTEERPVASIPVSYTHLDVYKRQVHRDVLVAPSRAAQVGDALAAQTEHRAGLRALGEDVYKRQAQSGVRTSPSSRCSVPMQPWPSLRASSAARSIARRALGRVPA